MAIYFGNLDRELADRQNVLKEDAARQYRGNRDTMNAFSSLGSTVAGEIKNYKDDKKQNALLEYEITRKNERDAQNRENQIRLEEGHEARQLDYRLKNIGLMQKLSVDEYISKLWKYRDPKVLQKNHQKALDDANKDTSTVDAAQRIRKYRHLYGNDAYTALRKYELLKKKGVDEKAIMEARTALDGYSPISFMDYADEQGLRDKTISKDYNPRAHTNSMFMQVLRDAGYPMADPGKITKEYKTTSLTDTSDDGKGDDGNDFKQIRNLVKKASINNDTKEGSESSASTILSNTELLNSVDIQNPLPDETTRNPDGSIKEYNKTDLDYINDRRQASAWMSKLPSANLPTGSEGSPIPPDEEDQVAVEGKTRYDKYGNLISADKTDADYLNFVEGIKGNTSNQKEGVYSGFNTSPHEEIEQEEENLFTVIKNSLFGGHRIKAYEDKLNKQGRPAIPTDPSRWRGEGGDTATGEYKGNEIDSISSMTPYNFNKFFNGLPKKEQDLLQGDPLVNDGNSMQSVYVMRKIEDELAIVDDEIFYLDTEISKHLTPIRHTGNKKNAEREAESLDMFIRGSKGEKIKQDSPALARAKLNKKMVLPIKLEQKKKLEKQLVRATKSVESTASPANVITSSDLGVREATTPRQTMNTNDIVLNTLRENEGRGVHGLGNAYFDGSSPDKFGNYNKAGSSHLTLSGGLNVYDSMVGSTKEEKEDLADLAFANDPIKKREFLKYLTMDKSSHKDFYRTNDQRSKLRLTENQQEILTDYMYKDHLDKLIKHHPYLKNISSFPVDMQVFLADTSFNMGPRWMKDKFKKFEKHLKSWVTRGKKPKEVEGMIREFKDSDHYRRWGHIERSKNSVARLEGLIPGRAG